MERCYAGEMEEPQGPDPSLQRAVELMTTWLHSSDAEGIVNLVGNDLGLALAEGRLVEDAGQLIAGLMSLSATFWANSSRRRRSRWWPSFRQRAGWRHGTSLRPADGGIRRAAQRCAGCRAGCSRGSRRLPAPDPALRRQVEVAVGTSGRDAVASAIKRKMLAATPTTEAMRQTTRPMPSERGK